MPGNTTYQKLQRSINANVSVSNVKDIPFYRRGMILRGLDSNIQQNST
jgi:hypothetical protein